MGFFSFVKKAAKTVASPFSKGAKLVSTLGKAYTATDKAIRGATGFIDRNILQPVESILPTVERIPIIGKYAELLQDGINKARSIAKEANKTQRRVESSARGVGIKLHSQNKYNPTKEEIKEELLRLRK